MYSTMPIYKDNHCNRIAGRVGKEYGKKTTTAPKKKRTIIIKKKSPPAPTPAPAPKKRTITVMKQQGPRNLIKGFGIEREEGPRNLIKGFGIKRIPKTEPKPVKASKATARGRTKIVHGEDFESKYHFKRAFNSDSPDTTLYIDEKTGKIFDNQTGGRSIGKKNKDGTIKYSGKDGAVLHRHSSGIYYNKDKYTKDWWKKHAEKQSKLPPSRTRDTEQLSYDGYKINRFS